VKKSKLDGIDDERIVDERKEKGNGRKIFFYVALKACEEGTRRRRLRLID